MIQLLAAIATVLLVMLFTHLMSKYISARLAAATMLCSIAFIYVGFSLSGNHVGSIIFEVLVAAGFYLVAVIGYSKNNSLIAYGIVLHGIWDILHHRTSFVQIDIPGYWPVYCSIVDILLGAYFLVLFKFQHNDKRKLEITDRLKFS